MITFPQVNFANFLTSSSLPVMKIALIIEKPEVGAVLPSLAAEGAALWCSPEPSYISLGSSPFRTSACSQHCFHFRSCKIIPVLQFAFTGNIPQRPACTWLKMIKTGMCVQQKREEMSVLCEKKMRSSCTDSFQAACVILIAVQPTKLLFQE